MNSKTISRCLGQSVIRRKIGFRLLSITTLWEWYICRQMWQALARIEAPFSFLDAGSGMGQHAFAVAKRFPASDVTAIELDGEQVRDCAVVAQKLGYGNLRFLNGDLADFHYDETFDVILCSHILEHIQNDVPVIHALYKGLKKNGTLIVYSPTSEHRVLDSLGRTIHRMVKKSGDVYPHQHVRYYTAGDLCQKLQQDGFQVVSVIVTYGPYGRLAYDIVTSVQYSPFFQWIFPFYLLFIHPFVLTLMWADYSTKNRDGNGLLVVAIKNEK
jgi:2-polyprenyl-3-methyl-5-hydroxy-6-metoxy-1,4-benzoquinol methylase